MTVTDITNGKKGRLYLFIDGEFALSAYPDLLLEYHIEKGSELSPAALSDLKHRQNVLYARNRALDILSAGDCTKKRLYEKLITREISPEYAKRAVDYCEERGFIDDERLLSRVVPYYFNSKGYGKLRVRQALLHKGFERELVDEFLADYETDSLPVLIEYLQKETSKKLVDKKECQKIIQKLMRKGFTYGDIRTALSRFMEWEDFDE